MHVWAKYIIKHKIKLVKITREFELFKNFSNFIYYLSKKMWIFGEK